MHGDNHSRLVLQLLKSSDGWPVPRCYGTCGRFVVEEHGGESIGNSESYDWADRASVALQLLQAAKNFTSDHPDFRFYLTDVSPDNVAVDERMKVTFVDLENVVVTQKISSGTKRSFFRFRSTFLIIYVYVFPLFIVH